MITIHALCQQWNQNPPSSPAHTTTQENHKIEAIKKLIDSEFSQIEERISSGEQQIRSQSVEQNRGVD